MESEWQQAPNQKPRILALPPSTPGSGDLYECRWRIRATSRNGVYGMDGVYRTGEIEGKGGKRPPQSESLFLFSLSRISFTQILGVNSPPVHSLWETG